jgi:hypothetical protein
MSLRIGGVRARIAIALLLIAACLLPACGRKAKPQPLWGKSPISLLQSQMR